MKSDHALVMAVREQLDKIRGKADAARGRGQQSVVLDVDDVRFLLGLGSVACEATFSKPAAAPVGRSASASSVGGRPSSDVVASGAAVAGEETSVVIGFGGKAGR